MTVAFELGFPVASNKHSHEYYGFDFVGNNLFCYTSNISTDKTPTKFTRKKKTGSYDTEYVQMSAQNAADYGFEQFKDYVLVETKHSSSTLSEYVVLAYETVKVTKEYSKFVVSSSKKTKGYPEYMVRDTSFLYSIPLNLLKKEKVIVIRDPVRVALVEVGLLPEDAARKIISSRKPKNAIMPLKRSGAIVDSVEYKKLVDGITSYSVKTNLQDIGVHLSAMNTTEKLHIDHMYSKQAGFENGIDPILIGHPANLEITGEKYNIAKNSRRVDTLYSLCRAIMSHEPSNTISYQLAKEHVDYIHTQFSENECDTHMTMASVHRNFVEKIEKNERQKFSSIQPAINKRN